MRTLYGLRLWSVTVEYIYTFDAGRGKGKGTVNLWITTTRESITMATKKTRTFLKHHRDQYPKAKITAVKSSGFIDA